ncbi:hypothetical protein QJS04_geneDACA017696 [Acorus gramineus]|uniref:Protein TIFY n=1 Tax=Acorus gramineus TaxID=55184 RepID=A0AAV9BTJ6_ACOGR|nr:hypothetical protein QJS04_geneDACA017696 [Acorus gramineus]
MGSKYDSDSDLCVLRLGSAVTEAAAGEFQRRQQNNNHHQNQQLSIFYGGRVCVCDVTEIQAMEIINAAKRRTEEEEEERRRRREEEEEERMTGVSMKRSLQRFLQKRKTRSEVAKSPYFHPRTHTSSSST